ncbi:MAG: folate-binding protein YgfZ [Candidatus Accumulibacter sp.]|uniref:CAF17-like 4Fe-4S cluster assembly/insertion protein YgfZ n=1 Tax=Accumulibacter sp. TaxID=2053492 RepID=UPI001A60F6AC|nr:folate-binding protein [Accumulibacter sp.]MBL8390518.1 folate-binding protein YgfZ [Accumulibacter sp.]HRD88036.1 folate-binding protein [Accumulibacter sp.]
MNANWQEFLRASGARVDRDQVADFGDAAAELAAAREATIIAPLSHLGLLELRGPDAASFLHNQLTSDVRHLADDRAQHSAWCSAKGRMLASFLLLHCGSDYILQLSADLLPFIHKRLSMFVLRSRLSISDCSGERQLIGIAGPQAESALLSAGLPVPPAPLDVAATGASLIVRLDDRRFELITSLDTASDLWRQLQAQARPAGTAAWQWLDIQAGVPLINEQTREEFVPQMAGLDQLGAVSFRKGCYPGQEIVARTQYLGKVKRHLYRAHCASPMTAGQAIYSASSPQQACGIIANAAAAPAGGHDALAIIQESFAAAGGLQLGNPGGAAIDVEPVVPPAATP